MTRWLLVFVFCLAAIAGKAEAEPMPGTATYAGAAGDVIVMDISLENGTHIEINKDPANLINRQMSGLPSQGDGEQEGARI